MEFRILGPLEVTENGQSVALGAAQQQALLGVLLLRANEVVSAEGLEDALWGESPPATAPKVVQAYVSRLRRLLGAGAIETRPGGYLARVPPEDLDALR